MTRETIHQVLIVVGDATETVDTLYPYYRLQEAGFEPVVIAPERRTYQMVLHEVRPGWTITKEWEGYQINADLAFATCGPTTIWASSIAAVGRPSTSATTRIS
jgi:protease I